MRKIRCCRIHWVFGDKILPQSPPARPSWRLCSGQKGLLHLYWCCHFFSCWTLQSSRLPVKQLSSGPHSPGLEFASGQSENHSQIPLVLITPSVLVSLVLRLCMGPFTCVSLWGYPSLLSLWTVAPLKQVSMEIFFCLFWICCLREMGKRCSEHPMIRAGWGLVAALRQDLPAHLIHLSHNHMLLLGDYVLVSSLCN